MIVLRNKADSRAINVSYSEVGALYSTDTAGKFVAFKNAKIAYKPNSEFVQVEGDTTISLDYYLEPFNHIVFITKAEEEELSTLLKLEEELKKNKRKLEKNSFFRLKDLKKLQSLQRSEGAISIKARRIHYYVQNTTSSKQPIFID